MDQPDEATLKTLERRLAQLEMFLGEREPALVGLAQHLELEDPGAILTAPRACLPAVDAFLAKQRTSAQPEDPMWVLTRAGYLVGDALATELGGTWHVNEVPQSRTFTRYVVGRFTEIASPTAVIDPFEVAHSVVVGPPGASLVAVVEQIEKDLRALPRP